jgi:hypothetical protein
MRRSITILGVVVLAGLLPGTIAQAKTRSFNVDRATAIVAPEEHGAIRALIAFDLPMTELEGRWIRSAFLEFDVVQATETTLDVELAEISTHWTSATWTSPWRTPGGDWYQGLEIPLRIDLSETGTVRVNVTTEIREALEEGRAPSGFILMPGRHLDQQGLLGDEVARLGFLSAKLVVDHRRPYGPARQ